MLGLGNTVVSDFKTVYRDNYSLQFDGADQSVNIDSLVGSIDVSQGSISLWAKIETTSSTGTIFRTQVDSNNFISLLYHAGSNNTRAGYKGGGSIVQCSSDSEIEGDGAWHHIVATWSVANKQLKLYLDGSLIQTKPNSGSLPTLAGDLDSASIAQNAQGGSFFKGKVNDVAVFNETIALATVVQIYNSGKPNDISGLAGLIAYYKFENARGSVASETANVALDGTLVNTPTWSTDTP